MKSKLVFIGNSRGVRLPKTVIEECGLRDEIDLIVQGNTVMIRNADLPRKNWDKTFQQMSKNSDDRLLDTEIMSSWDKTNWKW